MRPIIALTIIIIAAAALLLAFSTRGPRVYTVGAGLLPGNITELYHTTASSAYPPEFLRYRFYNDGGARFFYREKREGDTWPLREEQITQSVTIKLTKDEWEEFLACLDGAAVTAREEDISSGGRRTDIFVYWSGDEGKYQKLQFASPSQEMAFEELCERLAGREGE